MNLKLCNEVQCSHLAEYTAGVESLHWIEANSSGALDRNNLAAASSVLCACDAKDKHLNKSIKREH
jgi:hypothetical protein